MIDHLFALMEDGASLRVECIDTRMASQYVKTGLLCVDRMNNTLVNYKQISISGLPVDRLVQLCEASGFVHELTQNGMDLLHKLGSNVLPHDRAVASIHCVLLFHARAHIIRHC